MEALDMIRMFLLSCCLCGLMAQEQWIQVDYWDREAQQTVYYCGLASATQLSACLGGQLRLLRLSSACWISYDEQDRPVSVEDFADWKDTDVIYVNCELIEKIIELRGDPRLLIADWKLSDPP
jgi:hypothetical protein